MKREISFFPKWRPKDHFNCTYHDRRHSFADSHLGLLSRVPLGNEAMTTIESRESDAAKWDSYFYDGWSSFYSPVTIVSTPPPARHKLSIYRSLQVIHDDREFVRSGYTDPRWCEWASRTRSYSLRASRYSNFLKQFIRMAMPQHKLEPTIDTTVL